MNADAPLSAQVAAALGGLGTTADEIAQALENKGIRAVQSDSSSCALSAYVTEQFPELHGDFTTGRHVAGTSDFCVGLTVAQQQFVYAFDHGDYPNLVSS